MNLLFDNIIPFTWMAVVISYAFIITFDSAIISIPLGILNVVLNTCY